MVEGTILNSNFVADNFCKTSPEPQRSFSMVACGSLTTLWDKQCIKEAATIILQSLSHQFPIDVSAVVTNYTFHRKLELPRIR